MVGSGTGNQIQLVARGNIDASLTGNPSITFFKSVYRKHTNFSMEDMVVDTISKPLAGHKYPVKIPTGTGDLLYGTNYILKGNKTYCGNGIGNVSTAVIDNIAFHINSREIDKTYGHYLEVYHELNQENPNSTITNLGRIEDSSLYHIAHNAAAAAEVKVSPTQLMNGLGHPPTHFQRMSKCGGTYCRGRVDSAGPPGVDILGECTVPLNFWYCRSPGLAIPLCALHKSTDVELYMQFSTTTDAHWAFDPDADAVASITYDDVDGTWGKIGNVYEAEGGDVVLTPILASTNKFSFNVDISVTYIYLDNMERKRFSQSSHEYLIEQLQFTYENGQKKKDIDISSFQHPVKELIWTGQPYLKSNITSAPEAASYDAATGTPEAASISETVQYLNNGTYAEPSGVRWVFGNTRDNDCLYGGGHNLGAANFSLGVASLPAAGPIGHGKFVQGLLGPSTPDCLDYVTYKIKFNSTDRCQPRPLQYFTRENVYKHHKGGCISVPDSIAVYSFALNPTDTSPSGTCNFSNIDDIKIERGHSGSDADEKKYKKTNIYAINYNILRIVNGKAGISYF
jgi:hypothetical protein